MVRYRYVYAVVLVQDSIANNEKQINKSWKKIKHEFSDHMIYVPIYS